MIKRKTMRLSNHFSITITLVMIVFSISFFNPAFGEDEITNAPCGTDYMNNMMQTLNAANASGIEALEKLGYVMLTGLSIILDEGENEEVYITVRDSYLIGKLVLIIGEDAFETKFNQDILFSELLIESNTDWNTVLNEIITAFPDSMDKLKTTFDAFAKAETLPEYSLLGATLHQDDDKNPRFSITGELHREGPQCDIYNIPYQIKLKDGEVFEGTFDMPGKIASFEIGLATQPVSIEIDPGFEMFRYIPKEDRSEDEILNSNLTETFSFIVVCDKGACFTVDIE